MLRFKTCAPLVGVLLLLNACANQPLRLYSETRDQQGQAVKKAWAEAEVDKVIAVQRENNVRLLAEQLAAEDRIALASRDAQILALVFGDNDAGSADPAQACAACTVAALNTSIGEDVITAAGSEAALTDWRDNQAELAKFKAAMADREKELRRFGFEMPSCADLVSGEASAAFAPWIAARPGMDGAVIKHALDTAGQRCQAETARVAEFDRKKTPFAAASRLGITRAMIAADAAAMEQLRAASLNARNAYRIAAADYADLAAQLGTNPSPDARAKVKQLAETVRARFDVILKLDDVFSAQFVAKEKRDAVGAFLGAVADTKAGAQPPADTGRAAMALILLPDLADHTRSWFADAKKPLLVPAVMRRNFEQLNLEAANRRIAAKQTRLALGQAKFDAQLAQAKAYLKARGSLSRLTPAALQAQTRKVDALPQLEDRRRIHEALGIYFDAKGRLDAEWRKADYKIMAADQEEQLSLAEVNVRQWQSLIGSSVDQMAQFGATGVKSEHVIGALNSVALLIIAAGVN
ncbi:hypothetical protein [Massilia sp. CF038]|uniref:hypothetical protein n=1 Tax=Massilia sp. CF038 TaxID=1881045 RepID=UPI001160E460|nr:hypothetical protein [Massilia sp. CF038]